MAPSANKSKGDFILRPLRLSDIPILAEQENEAYRDNPVKKIIRPRASLYPEDLLRVTARGIRTRHLQHYLSIVACPVDDPSTPVGYGQFNRLGNDEGARGYIQSRGLPLRIWFYLLSWTFWVEKQLEDRFWPDRCTDFDAFKTFVFWNVVDDEIHWKLNPERANRWHVSSLMVAPRCQGRGIGTLIMTEATTVADKTKTIMGLIASLAGDKLYRSVGFELLGEFTHKVGDEEGGGIMLRYPK